MKLCCMPTLFARLFTVCLLAWTLPWANAQQPLRIGLVLGGGGARGAAHVGVLQKLQELQVPVDCVAGTSMGGLVAGAFALFVQHYGRSRA